jgi:hypothetical protein
MTLMRRRLKLNTSPVAAKKCRRGGFIARRPATGNCKRRFDIASPRGLISINTLPVQIGTSWP